MLRKLILAAAAAFGIACALPVQAAYWSLFNIEGESTLTAQYVTYASLTDMLGDTNRLGVFNPGAFGANIVGSGSDGLRTVSPVSEPANIALLGIGLAGLAAARRRSQRSAAPGGSPDCEPPDKARQ